MGLKEYISVILKRMWLIMIIMIIGALAGAVKNEYFTTPQYQASAKLIVNQAIQNTDDNTPDIGVVQANLMLMDSYKEIIKSSAILDRVNLRYPDIDVKFSNLSVTSADNSQVMNVAYVDTSYARAAKSVNAVLTSFKEQIPSIMKVDNVTILNEAKLSDDAGPINTHPALNLMLCVIAAMMIAVGLVFLLEYLDNTFRSEQELETELELEILTTVNQFSSRHLKKARDPASKKQVGDGKYATFTQ